MRSVILLLAICAYAAAHVVYAPGYTGTSSVTYHGKSPVKYVVPTATTGVKYVVPSSKYYTYPSYSQYYTNPYYNYGTYGSYSYPYTVGSTYSTPYSYYPYSQYYVSG